MRNRYSLMVHGGAGALNRIKTEHQKFPYLEGIRNVLESGREILAKGGSALRTVEICASMLEDEPLFNAGYGSVLNEQGKVEMDAAIMDGRDLSAGSVAGIQNVANPIQLAKLVLLNSEHVLLAGEGAHRFAEQHGMEKVTDDYFLTEDRIQQFNDVKIKGKIVLDHEDGTLPGDEDPKFGTIGAIARDCCGNLAAATSTGGMVNKRIGRIGDSPVIGAGLYADNETCAVSATGYGEDFLRTVLSKTVSDVIELLGYDADRGAGYAIDFLVRKVQGQGGIIVIDHEGNCASRFSTKKMIRGWIEHGGEACCTF